MVKTLKEVMKKVNKVYDTTFVYFDEEEGFILHKDKIELLCECMPILLDEKTEKKLIKEGYLKEGIDYPSKQVVTTQEPKNKDPKSEDFLTIIDVDKEYGKVWTVKNAIAMECFLTKEEAIEVTKEVNSLL